MPADPQTADLLLFPAGLWASAGAAVLLRQSMRDGTGKGFVLCAWVGDESDVRALNAARALACFV